MNRVIEGFFQTLISEENTCAIYSKDTPKEMMKSDVDSDGWYEWQLVKSHLLLKDYEIIETKLNIIFPRVFKEWHQSYFFADCDCSLVRLPHSLPHKPLQEIINTLDWHIPKQLIPAGLIPFGDEGNDTGPLVFDTRGLSGSDDYPIRVYDHEYGGDLDGLSDIIFSSFNKLLECMTHFLNERRIRKDFEVIPDFYEIDNLGAGSSGRNYWSDWSEMLRENFEEFGY